MQRLLILLCLTLWPLGLATRLPAVDASRPNLILILADDHGIGDVSATTTRECRLHISIDSVRRGCVLPRCVLTARSARLPGALLTGRYPDRSECLG